MRVESFVEIIGAEFYTGVPDSQLRPLCDYLMNTHGVDARHHIIAANEGNCAAIAAGYHLATGKLPVVYLQNSGEGNLINPVTSLLHQQVYGIPELFIVGWRGEPGIYDEPQHIYQGAITQKLLVDLEIPIFVVGPETTKTAVQNTMEYFHSLFVEGRSAAFVIRKGGLVYHQKVFYQNAYTMNREDVIRHIVETVREDFVVSTTGKASRELFEIRVQKGQTHDRDFLTVGSMGHASSIALGIALHRPDVRVWCIDGDGAALMHMGAMAVIGASKPHNLIHIVLNNGAHETVGGMPTAAEDIDLLGIARACGYPYVTSAVDFAALDAMLAEAKAQDTLCFIEAKCALGARNDLGRPTSSPLENKRAFVACLKSAGNSNESC